MTAIVGLVHNGEVHVGGDSAGLSGSLMTIRADAKVFTNGPYVFGFTTSFRMGQLIRYSADPPAPDTTHLDAFMATTFVDAIRDCLKAGGWAQKTEERERGGVFLVGTCGRLFTVEADYQVAEAADGVRRGRLRARGRPRGAVRHRRVRDEAQGAHPVGVMGGGTVLRGRSWPVHLRDRGRRTAVSKLDSAVEAILAGEHDRDEWTALCVAAVRLGHAMAVFDHARRRYVAANPPPPGGWPRTGSRR